MHQPHLIAQTKHGSGLHKCITRAAYISILCSTFQSKNAWTKLLRDGTSPYNSVQSVARPTHHLKLMKHDGLPHTLIPYVCTTKLPACVTQRYLRSSGFAASGSAANLQRGDDSGTRFSHHREAPERDLPVPGTQEHVDKLEDWKVERLQISCRLYNLLPFRLPKPLHRVELLGAPKSMCTEENAGCLVTDRRVPSSNR